MRVKLRSYDKCAIDRRMFLKKIGGWELVKRYRNIIFQYVVIMKK
jgi:hypothetical protein